MNDNNYNKPAKLISPYKHVELYSKLRHGKSNGFYDRATSYHRTPQGFVVNDCLLPKRAICTMCNYWFSQNQTKAIIKTLRERFGRGYCPECRHRFDSLDSVF